jgi:hypothetical protein
MSKKKSIRKEGSRSRRISVRGVQRDEPDIRRLSQALIGLALAQTEADAEREQREAAQSLTPKPKNPGDKDQRVA